MLTLPQRYFMNGFIPLSLDAVVDHFLFAPAGLDLNSNLTYVWYRVTILDARRVKRIDSKRTSGMSTSVG